jgi:hypothetical protein
MGSFEIQDALAKFVLRPNTADEKHAAAMYVCAHSDDVAEATTFLQMLGLA